MSTKHTLRRKAYDQLIDWKRSSCGKLAVMVEGARRVGKSTVAEALAASEHDDYLLLDLSMDI